MSDPLLGLTMLGLIVVAIMMGFPTAFTLMGLGMGFGFLAFWDPSHPWFENRVFDLMVHRTFGGMNNDTLVSIPLFVFMGYVIERAALVDKMFYSVQLAFKRLPASLAVTTLLVCAFWGIASGIVGAVVVLMGVIALRPMLNAGYDVKLASGVITAGGTLGILIPPSVMLIVYAAIAGQSIVKLYAAAMFPGVFLTLLYLLYIVGLAVINPKVAPKLPKSAYRVEPPAWIASLQQGPSQRVIGTLTSAVFGLCPLKGVVAPDGKPVTYGLIMETFVSAMVPLLLTVTLFASAWWYVMIRNAPAVEPVRPASVVTQQADTPAPEAGLVELGAGGGGAPDEGLVELGVGGGVVPEDSGDGQFQELGDSSRPRSDSGVGQAPENFQAWFWGLAAAFALLLVRYYARMDGERLEILKLLVASVIPLGVLTFVVLAVILFGITTATESAAIGSLGALYLASYEKHRRWTAWSTIVGLVVGVGLGMLQHNAITLIVAGSLGAVFIGTVVPWILDFLGPRQLLRTLKESTFLTAKTTAMVCWLFVGSALFSGVFALHGGQQVIEHWVVGLNMTPLQFLLLSQAIIFLLGWPLEWTEIIVIFVPIFLPLLAHFNVDPVLFATMVAVNLQAAFLSPPVAMSAFYLKGVAPKHVTLNQIFAGMMPYMFIVILCLVLMYVWPAMTLWLPNFVYGS
jgi:TRAP-type mannitol/chloroaromatic compound transport system permease large subunit